MAYLNTNESLQILSKENKCRKGQCFRYLSCKGSYQYYLMLIPGIAFFIVFSYVPMAGLVLAFKEYSFSKGIIGSP